MNEELFQFVWRAGLFNANGLFTSDGRELTVLQRGKLNRDAGPDFSHALVRMDDTDWAGHVELHLNASDWHKHGHHRDPAYNAVILHAVLHNDEPCRREDGTELPCVELKDRIPAGITGRYDLLKEGNGIPCARFLPQMDAFTVEQTLSRYLVQRLERKGERIRQRLKETRGDWMSVLYLSLARSFGFGTNAEAFEQLALQLPLSIVGRHAGSESETEALVFGSAGFLSKESGDDYYLNLKKQWDFLRIKYHLQAMSSSVFRHMRMRPGNFPGIRLAQFASLAALCPEIFRCISADDGTENLHTLLTCRASGYWSAHYVFSKPSAGHSPVLSKDSVDRIIINGIVPYLFVLGREQGNAGLSDKAIEWLAGLPPENNWVVREWASHGIGAAHAGDTQAMLELRQYACSEKQCLNCPVGYKVLNAG